MRTALAATLAVASLAAPFAVAVPQPAEARTAQEFQIRAQTPQCRDFPQYTWVGRVAGVKGARPPRHVHFHGCFPTFAACEEWRRPVSGYITGRIVQNECAER